MWHNEMLVTSQVDDKSGKHLVWKHFVVATLTLQLAEPLDRYGNESKERSFLEKFIKVGDKVRLEHIKDKKANGLTNMADHLALFGKAT